MSIILQDEGKENGRAKRPNAAQRRKKRRRLNDLDSDSTMDEEESEEEFRLSERYNRNLLIPFTISNPPFKTSLFHLLLIYKGLTFLLL